MASPSRCARGEILGLIGPNGSGKSTTFNLIAGLSLPTAGSIRLEGARSAGCRRACLPRRHGAHVPDPAAVPPAVDPATTRARRVLRRAATARPRRGRAPRGRGARAGRPAAHPRRAASTAWALPALKKLELARALATQPKLLLADESLGGLDETEMEQAADMLAGSATSAASPSSGSSTSWAC